MDDFKAIENLTNETFGYESTLAQTTYLLVYEIVFAVLCVLAICINIALIYTLFRYKKLHTIPNIFIANWAIADLCFLIVLPINVTLIEIFDNVFSLPIIIFYEIEYALQNAIMLFVAAVSIDWCLASYFPRAIKKFRDYYKFPIAIIWTLVLLSICISVGLDMHDLYFHLPMMFYFVGYFAFLIFIFMLHISKAIKKCRKIPLNHPTLMLTLATTLLICWMPFWIGHTVHLVVKYCPYLEDMSYLSTSVVTFITLYRCNQDFQACYQQAVKCSNNRYADDISEFRNFPDNINTENEPSQICVH